MQHSSIMHVATSRKEDHICAKNSSEDRRRVDQLSSGTKARVDREYLEIEAKLQKGRAAAWAWYEHGQSGNEKAFMSNISGGGVSSLSTVGGYERGKKSSRFKAEVLENSGQSISTRTEKKGRLPGACNDGRIECAQSWELPNILGNRSSSLFDSYELDSLSKLIDIAVQTSGSTLDSNPITELTVRDEGKWSSTRRNAVGFPPPIAPAGTPAHNLKEATAPHDYQVLAGSSREETRGSKFRKSFPRYGCRSVSDVVTPEEMSLGGNYKVRNDHRQKTRANDSRDHGNGWKLGRITLPKV